MFAVDQPTRLGPRACLSKREKGLQDSLGKFLALESPSDLETRPHGFSSTGMPEVLALSCLLTALHPSCFPTG